MGWWQRVLYKLFGWSAQAGLATVFFLRKEGFADNAASTKKIVTDPPVAM
jgi:hypothetical protein